MIRARGSWSGVPACRWEAATQACMVSCRRRIEKVLERSKRRTAASVLGMGMLLRGW